MALDFSLEIATERKLNDLSNLIIQLDGFHQAEDKNCFFANGLFGGIKLKDEISQEILQEEVGILANVRVWYRLDTDNYEAGMRNGLRAFMIVLQNVSGNAVIRLNGDDVKLLRVDENITLNSNSFSKDDDALWRLKDVPLPFKLQEFAGSN